MRPWNLWAFPSGTAVDVVSMSAGLAGVSSASLLINSVTLDKLPNQVFDFLGGTME